MYFAEMNKMWNKNFISLFDLNKMKKMCLCYIL